MKYEIIENKIIVKVNDFDPRHILECGQVFRFNKKNDEYYVYSRDMMATIKPFDFGYVIITKDVDYFINYFDLHRDYGTIKEELKSNDFIKMAIEKSGGIRILKQDLFETLISFIISSNNNIKRIKQIIEKICVSVGKNMGEYFAFPTLEEMSKSNEELFKKCGAGYRAKYLVKVCSQFEKFSKLPFEQMTTDELRAELLKLSGVGPKVADCILLFAFSRTDVFPVDTWIEKAYYQFFGKETITRKQITDFFVKIFNKNAGFAQQYLFYYKTVERL